VKQLQLLSKRAVTHQHLLQVQSVLLGYRPVVGCLILDVQLCCFWVGWACAVGVCEHALYAHQHSANVVAGRPLVLQRVLQTTTATVHTNSQSVSTAVYCKVCAQPAGCNTGGMGLLRHCDSTARSCSCHSGSNWGRDSCSFPVLSHLTMQMLPSAYTCRQRSKHTPHHSMSQEQKSSSMQLPSQHANPHGQARLSVATLIARCDGVMPDHCGCKTAAEAAPGQLTSAAIAGLHWDGTSRK
jgi:hypothetical protein